MIGNKFLFFVSYINVRIRIIKFKFDCAMISDKNQPKKEFDQ